MPKITPTYWLRIYGTEIVVGDKEYKNLYKRDMVIIKDKKTGELRLTLKAFKKQYA